MRPWTSSPLSGRWLIRCVAILRWLAAHRSASLRRRPGPGLRVHRRRAGMAFVRGLRTTAAERAFGRRRLGVMPWMTLQVAAFASQFSGPDRGARPHLPGPLFLLALLLWMGRGLPPSTVLAAVARSSPRCCSWRCRSRACLTSRSAAIRSLQSPAAAFDPPGRGRHRCPDRLALGALAAALGVPRRSRVESLHRCCSS